MIAEAKGPKESGVASDLPPQSIGASGRNLIAEARGKESGVASDLPPQSIAASGRNLIAEARGPKESGVASDLPPQSIGLPGLMLFCQAYGPPECFKGWHSSRLREYLIFHLEAGTAVVQTSGQRVNGILIGWQDYECKVRARAEAGEHPWDWQGSAPDGDCIYLAECVARSRAVVPRLVGQLAQRMPEWRGLKWLAYRHGRLVRLDRMAEGLGISARRTLSAKKGRAANVEY